MEAIKVNLIPNGIPEACHASQYDEGRQIRIDLFNGLTPYTIQAGDTFTLNVRKPDNHVITQTVTGTEGDTYLVVDTTEQMTAVAGKNLCEIRVTNGGDNIGSLNFIMQVEKDVIANGIPSESVIEDLDALVAAAVGDDFYTKSEVDAKVAGLIDDESTANNKTWSSEKIAAAVIVSQMPNASQVGNSDLVVLTQPNAQAETGYSTAKTTVGAVAKKILGETEYVTDLPSFPEGKQNPFDALEELENTKASAESVTTLSNTVHSISEGGASKNLYPTNLLKNATGISYNNGVFSGLANDFLGVPTLENVFEENTRYTAQITTRLSSGSVTTGNGLIIRFLYSDGTYMSTYIPNATNSFTKFTLTSDEGKEVVGFKFTYASGGSTNTWDVKEVQVEEGTEATPYVSPDATPLTAIDKTARAELSLIPKLPWWSRFQNEFLRIAYSAIWVDKINTAVHWLFASDMGFNVLKGDVEITSDGELIMCHDPGFTFDENDRIINYNSGNNTLIKNMTYAECRSKFYADSPQRYGGYCPVADVDDFIRICKDKGKICFLTIRATNTAAVVAKALEKIRYYGMESRTILNAVQSSIIDVIRENPDANEIAVNYVAPEGQAITTTHVDNCLAWGNAFLSIWADGVTTVIDNSATAIAYAKEKGVPLLAAVNGDMSFWNYLIKKGIMGYQITKPTFDVEPKNQRFAVKMTSGTPTFENLFASNRFTATVSISGLRIYVSDVRITDSYLTDVIDGIQPIKMNMLNPFIRCIDTDGNTYNCVWSQAHNRFEITIPDTNDRTYRVLVTV